MTLATTRRAPSTVELGVVGTVRGLVVAEVVTAEHVVTRDPRFALAKFRPTTLPVALVSRSVLLDRLTEGAGRVLHR
jgi:hypothetical protein